MTTTKVIRYRTKPEQADENERLIRAVFAELAQEGPAGLHYATFRLDDGVSFVHVAVLDGEENPLTSSPAFAAFQAGIAERCGEGPMPRRSATSVCCRSRSAFGRKVGGTVARVRPGVIVLNGGSSSGKSSIATCLQRRLEGAWLTLGIDDLIRALSHGPTDMSAGGTLEFRSDGSIVVRAAFRRAETGWYEGLWEMARAGTPLIIDEVFLCGGNSQAP